MVAKLVMPNKVVGTAEAHVTEKKLRWLKVIKSDWPNLGTLENM